jgi:hypothetical protein
MEEIAGTIAYTAPEQIQGQPTPASDQYSLAIVLYEWLSGDLPFSGSFSEIASQQVIAAPPPIQAPAVSSEVEAVLQRALAKSPEQRFSNVQAFADAFEQATLEVGETVRVSPGWLPPDAHELQLHTEPSIEEIPTLRQKSGPTTEKILTRPSDVLDRSAKKVGKGLSMGAVIGILALILLVIISGIASLGIMAFSAAQVSSPPQGGTSAQTGVSAAAWQDKYTQVTSQKPLFTDPLNQNVNGWDTVTDAKRSCFLTNGVYHTRSLVPYNIAPCGNTKFTRLSNIAYQVRMTILRGNEGGIFFRLTVPSKMQLISYFFSLNSNGTYNLWAANVHFKTLLHNTSAAIKSGLNQSNLLTVIAKGKLIALYINNQYVNSIVDDSASTGAIGLLAQSIADTTEVAFSNLTVWKA